MAWTAPRTWSVSEVVTAAMMNAHVRDNLLYLKASPQFDGTIGVGVAASASYVAYLKNGALPMRLELATSAVNWLELRSSSADATNKWALRIRSVAEGDFTLYDMTAGADRFYLNSAGSLGIGTTAPAGRLHVTNAGAVSGAGMAISSLSAVTTIQTIFAAGTVTRAAVVWYIDRNNTGGALLSSPTGGVIALSGSINYINADTMTIAVTAGGAMTVVRASGTSGSHDVLIFALFY